jgi:hypothetical protein
MRGVRGSSWSGVMNREGKGIRRVLRQPIFFQSLIWGLGDTWAQPRQHGLHLGLLHVLLQVRLGDPVLVKCNAANYFVGAEPRRRRIGSWK